MIGSPANSRRYLFALAICLVTIVLRLVPQKGYHSSLNFSAMDALALFAVTFFGWGIRTFLIVLGTQFLGDLCLALLNRDWEYAFHQTFASNYLALAIIVGLGYFLSKKVDFLRTIPLAFSASLLFFLITNFHCWLVMNIYPKTWQGLMESYVAGIPFYKSTFLSDLYFSTTFCGLVQAYLSDESRVTNEANLIR